MKFYERKLRPVRENELGSIVGKGLVENSKYFTFHSERQELKNENYIRESAI
jgi:hypothetical protein